MSNNLMYGGIVYPDNSFVFDKIYNSFTQANEKANTDNVLVGRFILIAYTERPLMQWERNLAQCHVYYPNNSDLNAEPVSANIKNTLSVEIQQYIDQLLIDQQDYDRVVCRKVYKNNLMSYEPIANLSTTIDLTSAENNPFLEEFKRIVNTFDDIDDNLDADIAEALRLENSLKNDLNPEAQRLENVLAQTVQIAIEENAKGIENISKLQELNETSNSLKTELIPLIEAGKLITLKWNSF